MKINTPIIRIFSSQKKSCPPLRKVEACMRITTWSSRTLSFCMPSSVRWTMAPSHIIYLFLLLFFFFNTVQSALVMAKRARLDKIVGTLREKEEEPEGKVLGESSTGSLLFPPLFSTLLNKFILYLFVLPFFYNFPLQMNLKKMRRQNP